jgi:hypothetical protein
MVAGCGLPSSGVLSEVADRRLFREPWWRRIGAEPMRARQVSQTRPVPGDYDHADVYCLNDPMAAITFWRRSYHRMPASEPGVSSE